MNGFERHLSARRDELDWLYMELYHDREMLEGLKAMMARAYGGRSDFPNQALFGPYPLFPLPRRI